MDFDYGLSLYFVYDFMSFVSCILRFEDTACFPGLGPLGY